MCNDATFDPDLCIEDFTAKVDAIMEMQSVIDKMGKRDRDFAQSLWEQFKGTYSLSPRQWPWVYTLRDRVTAQEPLYGDFKAVLVMFQIAGEKLKAPKVRLMTNWRNQDPDAEHRFVQLTFKPKDEKRQRHPNAHVEVHVDGWQGHGYRKFAGWIEQDKIIPYKADRMTDEVRNCIQDFSLDPLKCARAMANLIGACMYCGSRLTDDISKAVGVGPICAGHYNVPWGKEAAENAKKEQRKLQDSYRRY